VESLIIKQPVAQAEVSQRGYEAKDKGNDRSFNEHLDDEVAKCKEEESKADSEVNNNLSDETGNDSKNNQEKEKPKEDYTAASGNEDESNSVVSNSGNSVANPNLVQQVVVVSSTNPKAESAKVAPSALGNVQNTPNKNPAIVSVESQHGQAQVDEGDVKPVASDRIVAQDHKEKNIAPSSSETQAKKPTIDASKTQSVPDIDIEDQIETNLDLSKAQQVLAAKMVGGANNDGKVRVQMAPSMAPDKVDAIAAQSAVSQLSESSVSESDNSKMLMTERTHILNKNWGSSIANKLNNLISKGANNIIARINPSSMGPIEIQINKVEDGMNISIFVNSLATKEVLDIHSERMQKSFSDGDMGLMNFDINHRDGGNNGDNKDSGREDSLYSSESSSVDDSDDIIVSGVGLIDSYA